MSEEVRMIRMLRHALAAIWTELEQDGDPETMIGHAQLIADDGLDLSGKYASKFKDLTDDSRGLESWRIHVGG